jgi:hypothetical protein
VKKLLIIALLLISVSCTKQVKLSDPRNFNPPVSQSTLEKDVPQEVIRLNLECLLEGETMLLSGIKIANDWRFSISYLPDLGGQNWGPSIHGRGEFNEDNSLSIFSELQNEPTLVQDEGDVISNYLLIELNSDLTAGKLSSGSVILGPDELPMVGPSINEAPLLDCKISNGDGVSYVNSDENKIISE